MLPPSRLELLRKRILSEYVELETFQIEPTQLQADELQVHLSFYSIIIRLLFNYCLIIIQLLLFVNIVQGRQSGSEEWRTERGETGDREREREAATCAIPLPITKPALKPLPIHKKRVFNLDSSKITLSGAAKFYNSSVRILFIICVICSVFLIREGITPASNQEKGGVFITEMMDVRKGFTVGFDFRLATRGADGFAFVVHRYNKEKEWNKKEYKKE